MKRNKYINTFSTTSQFDTYIESAEPGFPNVALTEDDGAIHYTQTSPNSHLIYGTLIDSSSAPVFIFKSGSYATQNVTSTIDGSDSFYIDGVYDPTNGQCIVYSGKTNITKLKKLNINTSNMNNMTSMFENLTNVVTIDLSRFDTHNVQRMVGMFNGDSSLVTLDCSTFDVSQVTTTYGMFQNCSSLTSLDLSNWIIQSSVDISNMFNGCNSLTDVYINNESTLNKLTNNLSSRGNNYIPSSATIHYDNGSGNVDYVWQNNAWKAQS